MVAICPNEFRDHELLLTQKIKDLLSENDIPFLICPVYGDSCYSFFPESEVGKIEELKDDCQLAIAIGGDGTILAAERRLSSHSIPLLGINMGTKGFLAALEVDDYNQVLDAIRGNVSFIERMMLNVSVVRNGMQIYSGTALNDAVIHGCGDCIHLDVFCNSLKMSSFSGDGIILATPTGSTGYSMSAGGPIVEPEADNIIVSPICAHSITARTFVLSSDRTVKVLPSKIHDRKAYLSVDGQIAVYLNGDDQILVCNSEHKAVFACTENTNFFENVLNKLI